MFHVKHNLPAPTTYRRPSWSLRASRRLDVLAAAASETVPNTPVTQESTRDGRTMPSRLRSPAWRMAWAPACTARVFHVKQETLRQRFVTDVILRVRR
jgi:hypothetical protein